MTQASASEPRQFVVLCLGAALLIGGCGGDGDGDSNSDASTDATTSGSSSTPTTSGEATADTIPDPGGTSGATDPSGDPTAGMVGPNFGLLTFTLYPEDASGAPTQLGMAAAWRDEPPTTDDFFAARAFGLFAPLAPASVDTIEVDDMQAYDWGRPENWVTLGNGIRLRHAETSAVACLQLVQDSYPVYFSDDAAFLDPDCAADPTRWRPDSAYDLVVYGGEDYGDETREGIHTPTALELSTPDIRDFDFPLPKSEALALTWDSGGSSDDRVVIRMWDQFGRQLVAHAADDGNFTIPGTELDRLAAGPATLTVARERIYEFGLAPGNLRVVVRYELNAYPNLY